MIYFTTYISFNVDFNFNNFFIKSSLGNGFHFLLRSIKLNKLN